MVTTYESHCGNCGGSGSGQRFSGHQPAQDSPSTVNKDTDSPHTREPVTLDSELLPCLVSCHGEVAVSAVVAVVVSD
ncbi:hypothetical protein J6590_008677 [Homalodisca vitripennis]|nr:hypothetical protein J6590_008677 [Homalodisca vitripennis]